MPRDVTRYFHSLHSLTGIPSSAACPAARPSHFHAPRRGRLPRGAARSHGGCTRGRRLGWHLDEQGEGALGVPVARVRLRSADDEAGRRVDALLLHAPQEADRPLAVRRALMHGEKHREGEHGRRGAERRESVEQPVRGGIVERDRRDGERAGEQHLRVARRGAPAEVHLVAVGAPGRYGGTGRGVSGQYGKGWGW